MAFNKKIAKELRSRAPRHVTCSTLHSMGYKCLRQAWSHEPVVDEYKKHNIAKDLLPGSGAETRYVRSVLVKVASLVQGTLTDPTIEADVLSLMDRHNIDANGAELTILSTLPQLISISLSNTAVIDYEDMIYMPVVLGLPSEKYDWLFVDEAQDLNKAQLELVHRMVSEYGRVVAVCDRDWETTGI